MMIGAGMYCGIIGGGGGGTLANAAGLAKRLMKNGKVEASNSWFWVNGFRPVKSWALVSPMTAKTATTAMIDFMMKLQYNRGIY